MRVVGSDSVDDKNELYDVLIVGGGITGAGIARDATLRGLRVALFEKSDYGSGTSSKSSKLIHGGLRYLEHGEIGLVYESVSERAIQSQVAPHLVRPLPFLVPVYEESKPGLEVMNLGLWMYDTLALFRAPKMHKTYRGAKATELVPYLKEDGLKGAIEYYDCITDDARLVLENILDAAQRGARCHSHTEVVSLVWDPQTHVKTVTVMDTLTGMTATHRTRCVIVAVGPWTDFLVETLGIHLQRKLLRLTKGVHLVFPHEKLPIRRAITLMSPIDGRVLFAIPWKGRVVLGTTDTDFDGAPENVHANAQDAQYLCDSANAFFPQANFAPQEAIASWAGLRPLIQEEEATSESEVSREHEIFVDSRGIVLIAGGKLTTYRKMAKEVVRSAIRWMDLNDNTFAATLVKPRTKKRPLPGAQGLPDPSLDGVKKLARAITDEHNLDLETAMHLARVYGTRAQILAESIDNDDSLGLRIEANLPYVWAEVSFAVTHDLARTIEDVLARRIPLLLLGIDQGLDVMDRVANILQQTLQWSDQDRKHYETAYRDTVAKSRQYRLSS